MKISGFTIARNAEIYDFPLVESITSILDIVDEFVVALGKSDDNTEQIIRSIDSPKIKIIDTVWDTNKYNNGGSILAQQTDIALKACTGDWCFYIQADEVMHESAKPIVLAACKKYLNDERVEAFAFKYTHFYGDYDHYIDSLHFAYPREIRIVRNKPEIHSWRDAQSFKAIPDFNGDYLTKEGTRKLNTIFLDAYMYHYGWSRDPRCMTGKINNMRKIYNTNTEDAVEDYHDYGNLSSFPIFKGTHPAIMHQRLETISWRHCLRNDGPTADIRKIFGKKYRILRFIEVKILGSKRLFGFSNFKRIRG